MSKQIDAYDVKVGDRIRATRLYGDELATYEGTVQRVGRTYIDTKVHTLCTDDGFYTFELLDRPVPTLPVGTVALHPSAREHVVKLTADTFRYLDSEVEWRTNGGKTFDQLVASGEWIAKYQPGVS